MEMEEKYARLLVDYCLEIKEADQLYVRTTFLAEPLARSVYKCALERGAHVNIDFNFRGQKKLFFEASTSDEQLSWISPQQEKGIQEYDAYLMIRAPYNLREDAGINAQKLGDRAEHLKALNERYFARTADGTLRRSLCQYPTQASAQEAGMALDDYRHFVYNACKLFAADPAQAWRELGAKQQHIVDYLNQSSEMRYVSAKTDVSFSVKDRIWINSDGRSNMPSGEVFSAPVEDSVNGVVHFSYPAIYRGESVEDIVLKVKDGYITEWDARVGKKVLDEVFEIEGTRRFGEVAIGTNYDIQRVTKNILFDEKIGGSIHMAVGQSYVQNKGKNKSPVHWDMITDMRKGGKIFADETLIYEDGEFLIG